jgi:hypothetical protein
MPWNKSVKCDALYRIVNIYYDETEILTAVTINTVVFCDISFNLLCGYQCSYPEDGGNRVLGNVTTYKVALPKRL